MFKLRLWITSIALLALVVSCTGTATTAATQVPATATPMPTSTATSMPPTATTAPPTATATSMPPTATTAPPTATATPMPPTATTAPPTATATPSPTSQAAPPTVMIAKNATLGDILVNDQGFALYYFKNDQPDTSNCTGTCAELWPPLTVAQGTQPVAGPGVPGKLGVIQRADGTYQVTYDQMPLYTYAQDTQPGQTNGQGRANVWYVISITS
jgi:predicted lipoprotein with Yx(FWY)xxD motif